MTPCPSCHPLLVALVHADLVLSRITESLSMLETDTTALQPDLSTAIINSFTCEEEKANALLEYYVLLQAEYFPLDNGAERAAEIAEKLHAICIR